MMHLPQSADSKYRFILLFAKRARQLSGGAGPLIKMMSTIKSIKLAQLEVLAGLVPFENLKAESGAEANKQV
jgi:DNA-directed RNA polymerase subunit K/omega